MTKEALRDYVDFLRSQDEISYDVYSGLIDGIDTLEQEPRWIPVSERLPKKSGKYWCTFGGTYHMGIDSYCTKEDAEEIYEEPENCVGWTSQNVIVWMPLPKPYKPQENEK